VVDLKAKPRRNVKIVFVDARDFLSNTGNWFSMMISRNIFQNVFGGGEGGA